MSDRYEPPSNFLKEVIEDTVSFVGSEFAEANLQRLIDLTRDDDPANRDWATMLLAQEELDTPEVRSALLAAAEDEHEFVRGEAILGLAQRDRALALPLVHRELSGEWASLQIFEAAALVADASLIGPLRDYSEPSDDEFLDGLVLEAIAACEKARDNAVG